MIVQEIRKKELKNEELCEEKKELSTEELEQVTGGVMGPNVAGVIGTAVAAGPLLALLDNTVALK